MTGWDDPALSLAGGTPAPPTTDDAERSVDGPVIGRGGQGVVVAGRDPRLPREVAWKIVASGDARAIAQLEHEAAVLASLEHPAIVPVYALVHEPGGGARLALKQIRGRTLHAALGVDAAVVDARRALVERLRLLRHVLAAAEAIAWAHHRGVLHRDLKSRNIMVGEFGETQVIDWGLASRAGEEDPTGSVLGTPQSMSPEQARGERLDERTDVWGLGTVLYELVTGRSLHGATSAQTVIDRVARGWRPDARAIAPHAPPELLAIVSRALAPDPDERYPTVRDLIDDLAAFLDGRAVGAHRYSPWEILGRFVRSFRLPLTVGAGVLATLAVSIVIANLRITEERDDALAARDAAQAALVTAGLTNARRELADDFRAEAELAVAAVLAIDEHPEARGVLAAFARATRPVLAVSAALDGLSAGAWSCESLDLSHDGRRLLCGESHRVGIFDTGTGALLNAWREPHRHARLFGPKGETVLLTRSGALIALDTATGATQRHPSCGYQLEASAVAAIDHSWGCLVHFREGAPHRHTPCGAEIAQAVTPLDDGFAALCPDGVLVTTRAGITRRAATPFVSFIGEYRALVMTDGERAIIGTTHGQLHLVDADRGEVLAQATLRPARLVRSLRWAGGDRVLVEIDGAGPVIVHAESLATLGRLPRGERGAGLAGDRLVSLGDGRAGLAIGARPTVSTWRLADPAHVPSVRNRPYLLDGRPGLTSARLDGTLIALTHREHAELVEASSGVILARRSWPGIQGGVAKAIAPDGVGAQVVLSSTEVPSDPARAAGETFVGTGTYRRLVPIARPDGAPPRLARSATGAGLEIIDGLEVHGLRADRQYDLAATGPWLGALTDTPRVARLYDLSDAPVERGACADATAIAIGLLDLCAGSPGPACAPYLLVADRAGVRALDPIDCAIVRDFTSTGEPTLVAATRNHARDVTGPVAWIAVGTREGRVDLWDWAGRLRATLVAHDTAVRALAFDAIGATLASGAWDGRLRLYALDVVTAPREALVERVTRDWGRAAFEPSAHLHR